MSSDLGSADSKEGIKGSFHSGGGGGGEEEKKSSNPSKGSISSKSMGVNEQNRMGVKAQGIGKDKRIS